EFFGRLLFLSRLLGLLGVRVVGGILPLTDDFVVPELHQRDISRWLRFELTAKETVVDVRPAAAREHEAHHQRGGDRHGNDEQPLPARGRPPLFAGTSGSLGGLGRRGLVAVRRKPYWKLKAENLA